MLLCQQTRDTCSQCAGTSLCPTYTRIYFPRLWEVAGSFAGPTGQGTFRVKQL